MKSYIDFVNKHTNEIAFVVGAGTSLLEVYNSPLLEHIHNHVVVSVNSSFIMMPWAGGSPEKRYWISNDALCRRWNWWPLVKKSACNKIVRDSWKPHFHEIPDFHTFHIRPTSEGIINPDDTGLAYCSSVPSGIDLCIQMGCKCIYLLGVDQYMIGEKSHFWQYLPKEKQPRRIDFMMAPHKQQKDAFKYNDMAYPALKKFAEIKNVTIYNCNPSSRVEVFDKISFTDAIDDIG